MRHKASGPLADFWHRIPRAAAYRLEKAAKQVPVRALATLAVATCLGIGGVAALASVTGGPSTGPSESALDPANPEAERLPPTTQSPPTHGEGAPAPGASPSGQPRTPPPTSQADGPSSTDTDEATASASTETPPPAATPSQPSPDVSRRSSDEAPPNTSLSEEFPESDSALFMLSADEAASFNCSLDGGAFSPCDSPTHYTDLKPGWHTFAVSAVDSAGNADPTPAETRWLANNGNSGSDGAA
jgi:hypothetical protein